MTASLKERSAPEKPGALGDGLDVDVVGEALVLGVHLENLDAALDVRVVDGHLAIEATGAEEGGVEDVRAVGCCDDDGAGVALETVHLGEELVERLLALIVAAADAGTAGAAHGVNLIDEDDAGAFSLAFLKRSRTREAPTPTNISTNSEPEMEKKGTPARRQWPWRRRLPVPGDRRGAHPWGSWHRRW